MTSKAVTTYSANLDIASALSAPIPCPGCAGERLVLMRSVERVTFRCRSCGQSWWLEMGRLVPIDLTEPQA
jgi:transcription elongation factor Elf1